MAFTDTFTGTDGTLLHSYSSNWDGVGGGADGFMLSLTIQGGTCVGSNSPSNPSADQWIGGSFAASHYSKVVLPVGFNDTAGGAIVRAQPDAASFYYAYYDAGDSLVHIGECIHNVFTDWGTRSGYSLGTTLEIQADPTTSSTFYVKLNGTTTDTFTSKTTLTNGRAGVIAFGDSATVGITSWEGGDTPTSGGAYTLTAAQGSYSLNGQTAILTATHNPLTAAQGSYSLTGQTATFNYNVARSLPVETGTYILAGSPALIDTAMNAQSGSYSLNGQVATLSFVGLNNYSMVAAQGSYSLTGQVAGLRLSAKLAANTGNYTLTGQSAILRWSAQITAYRGQTMTMSRIKLGL